MMTPTNNAGEVKVESSKTATASSWWPWSSSTTDTVTKPGGWSNPLSWLSTQPTTPIAAAGGRYSRKSRRRHHRSKKGGKKRKSLRFRQGG